MIEKTLKKAIGLAFMICFQAVSAIPVFAEQTDRHLEVTVVKGNSFTNFMNLPVDAFVLYRYSEATDTWEPIPFQIDELDGGKVYGTGNGLLDPSDEIVFMARDKGDRAGETEWPEDPESRDHIRYEIVLNDPLTGRVAGWVYLYHSLTLERTGKTYLQYDSGMDQVESDTYRIRHGDSGFQEIVMLKTSAGGDGKDLMDRQKFRIKLLLDLGFMGEKEITIKEQMIDEKVDFIPGMGATFNVRKKSVETAGGGVVRLHRIVTLEAKVTVTGGLIDEMVYTFPFVTTYYSDYAEWKVDSLEIPRIQQDELHADAKEIRITTDLNVLANGMEVFGKYNPGIEGKGNRINGNPWDLQSTQLDWPGENWFLTRADPSYSASVQIKNASVVSLFRLRGDPLGDTRRIYFKDDSSLDLNDTGDRMSFGDLGVQVTGNSITGTIRFYSASYYLPYNIDTAGARTIYETHFHPLEPAASGQSLRYTLTLLSDPPEGGTIDVQPPGDTPYADSTVVLTAIVNQGFHFDRWNGMLNTMDNPFSFVMAADMTVTAHFLHLRNVTLATEPPGLDLEADGETFTSPATFIWIEGTSHEISASSLIDDPEGTRHLFSSWSQGGERIQSYQAQADAELTALFRTQHYLTTTEIPEDGGDVVPLPPGDWFNSDSLITVEAEPAAYYAFIGWSGDASGDTSPFSLLMDGPKQVTANFGNYPPVVNIPDTSFAEDDTLKISLAMMYSWIADQNNADSLLVITAKGGDRLDTKILLQTGMIHLYTSEENWYGEDTVLVTVTDPLGSSGKDNIRITVTPVPDPPLPPSLLSPQKDMSVLEWPDSIVFVWSEAYDPDPEDTVRYLFQLDTTQTFSSPRFIQVQPLFQTRYAFSWPDAYGDGSYFWRVFSLDRHFSPVVSEETGSLELATGLASPAQGGPDVPVLEQNYPNPFNQATSVRFGLPGPSRIELTVYNSRGQVVRVLEQGKMERGYYTKEWDGMDRDGKAVSTGIYFVVIKGDSFRLVRKALLLR